MSALSLKHADGRCLFGFTQCLVQAVTRHDVDLTTEDASIPLASEDSPIGVGLRVCLYG